jgi:hypothetical protein
MEVDTPTDEWTSAPQNICTYETEDVEMLDVDDFCSTPWSGITGNSYSPTQTMPGAFP